MRPLNLKVKGFTSFRDEQEVDFTDLDVFVLWGPVGAGKSSLLDAITYALFGYVERVGNQVSQLVSHGQTRLAVTLEFAVGDERYRVSRSTSHRGQSKALLERAVGDGWQSFGEGADLVREINKAIEGLIGLDYQAFTRAVVLPQGKFAEFLTGDASKRREILTELLGLELFKRMSQRAGEISRDARAQLDSKSDLLAREFAGIDPGALDQARESHAATKEALAAADKLVAKLAGIDKKWVVADEARKALARCVGDVRIASETFAVAGADLDAHAKVVAENDNELAAADAALRAADKAAAAAAKKRATAEGKWGSLEDLARLRSKAEAIEDARREQESTTAALRDAEEQLAARATAVVEATAALTARAEAAAAANAALREAEAAHDRAHATEVVAGLVADLEPGDPCPICERPLDAIPEAGRAEIDAAKKALHDARSAAETAAAAHGKAETALEVAKQRAEVARETLAQRTTDVANRKARVDALAEELAPVAVRGDLLEAIDKRTGELRALLLTEEQSARAADEAGKELERKKLAAARVKGEIDKAVVRMRSVALEPLCARVRDISVEIDVPEELPDDPGEAPEALAALAGQRSKELARVADELEALQEQRDRELDRLLDEARAALPSGVAVDVMSIGDVLAQARATAERLKVDEGLAAKAVKDLAERLEAKARYEEEIERHRNEHAVYRDLHRELRSDSIVQHLQAEALVALAHEASIHLQRLSSQRYRLAYEDDRFYVVDSWNGDERRNVATLSGGETFQASLAFALALSEQVQYLAVTERGRLDSLFLDEGFDTQDTETLDVVVDAIEQLGSDGRLVGVITHVRALADSFAVRLEVTKTPRGSTLRRAANDLAGA